MIELLQSLAKTSVPAILIVGGLVFLLLGLADKVYGELRVSQKNKKFASVVGMFLLVCGIGVELFAANPGGRQVQAAAFSMPVDWRSWQFHSGARPSFDCIRYRGRSKEHSDPWTDIICMDRELADADRALGDAYEAFRASLSPDRIPRAKEEQRNWIKARNEACRCDWTVFETYALLEGVATCLREETEKRIARLTSFVQAGEPR